MRDFISPGHKARDAQPIPDIANLALNYVLPPAGAHTPVPGKAAWDYLEHRKGIFSIFWSGRRDSNPRQPAWKAGTLPTELLPHS